MERAPEPEANDEVGAVVGWLEFHRDALAAKCDGMSPEQLVTASAPPSTLTLLGLVRHLTEIERDYLTNDLSGESRGTVYLSDDDDEADIENLDVSMVPESLDRWHQERQAANAVIARYDDLSALAPTGKASVRAYLLKVVQEYARHNGHADIIRERIDGARGE
ncbi:DinB family protein [Kribbella sp. NPDC050124]|uniref:DinB family protein n=1 Tax=Kribbella sp. NPDC050124 TaxID=3364114 RepID=UPI0037A1DC09